LEINHISSNNIQYSGRVNILANRGLLCGLSIVFVGTGWQKKLRKHPEDASCRFILLTAEPGAGNTEQGWEAYTILPDGALVNVPDPQFAPVLAARLVAEVVAADWLLPNEKRVMIQSLTLPSVHNCTSMDTILARLMFVAVSSDLILLERFLLLARQI
jgi:hypothetical protein